MCDSENEAPKLAESKAAAPTLLHATHNAASSEQRHHWPEIPGRCEVLESFESSQPALSSDSSRGEKIRCLHFLFRRYSSRHYGEDEHDQELSFEQDDLQPVAVL